jgi:hypothetical protein
MKNQDKLIKRYELYIYNKYQDLLKSGKNKDILNNFDLAKIFEYYSCIKLSEEFNQEFYEYSDIEPEFKEKNNMSKNDTGIDACNLIDTIVQCKLRDNNLSWKECSTFFGSNICIDDNKQLITKWKKMIITRNKNSELSNNLKYKKELFLDKTYDKDEIINYCENLILDRNIIKKEKVEIRDYQKEAIKLIKDMKQNLIINLPTGTGKNFIIAHSLKPNKFNYLILVPRIILLEQIEAEIVKYKPEYKKYIQKIGDNNSEYKKNRKITICVFNSVKIIDDYIKDFNYIFVDEAHHIVIPEIYKIDDNSIHDDNNDIECDDSDDSEGDDNDGDDSDNDDNDNNSDSDDSDNKKYLQIIKSYQKYNNNIYLSATIDKINGFQYYTKDIREMINKKYLCDYNITIPIFSDDPTNKNICEYLIKNYRNVIIYCNSQKEGKQINNIMNNIQKNCSEYIDCDTKKLERNKIINKYKSGELPFLVNVRILVEGFDAPITKGICFMHMPSSKTTLIQIIGRSLRLHNDKKLANIILPFSNKSDENNINNFLRIMARNDSRIRQSYINKKLGGYIDIFIDEKQQNIDEDNNIELRYEMIYDKIGILRNSEEIWQKNLEDVKKYIDENKKRPSSEDKNNNIKYLGNWLLHQQKKYINEKQIMTKDNIRKIWKEFINDDKYKQYFLSNEQEWNNNLEKVKKYIDENNKRPSSSDSNIDIQKMSKWISAQQINYSKKKKIMKNKTIYEIWKNFINNEKYKKYFTNNVDEWQNNLESVKKYMDENNKRPSVDDKNNNIRYLGQWISDQQKKYKERKYIMSNDIIYKLWTDFIKDDKYKKYFISNENIWQNNLESVKKYIDKNNKKPSTHDKNNDVKKLGQWMSNQHKYYENKKYSMSNENIYNHWKDFINDNKYKQYFISNEDIWQNNLESVKKYIDENNKKPFSIDKDSQIHKLGKWLSTQKDNYSKQKNIMKNNDIYNQWTNFINDDKYKKYFL